MGDLVLNKSHETSLWTYNIDKIKVCSLEQILWKKAPPPPPPPPPNSLLHLTPFYGEVLLLW